ARTTADCIGAHGAPKPPIVHAPKPREQGGAQGCPARDKRPPHQQFNPSTTRSFTGCTDQRGSNSMAAKKTKIYTRYQRLDAITVQDIRSMFRVFCRYYENTSLDQFLADLGKKTGAFLIRRKSDDAIVGFSTLGIYHMEVDGRRVRGLFSGDTILEKEYWGNRALNAAFVKRVVWEAIRDPFTPQYWFLISKGYKTFLLLSRNFPEYYPHPSKQTPHMKHIVEAYCDQLFPGKL